MNDKCLICGSNAKEHSSLNDKMIIDCSRCGKYEITNRGSAYFINLKNKLNNAKVSHWVRKNFNGKNRIILDGDKIKEIIYDFELPRPKEQADNFILGLGQDNNSLSNLMEVDLSVFASLIGSIDSDDANFILDHLEGVGLVETQGRSGESFLGTLTFLGWQRYHELLHESKDSTTVFMAMKFGKKETDNLYKNVLKDAVNKTGFELRKLDDNPKAGLIDDRLRVEIRKAKFLISDLTHENPGAYFEAGFAEGLGKKVIYICEKKKFEKDKTHFDTNHSLTLTWDLENPKEFEEQLKATIRTTFPIEAKMEDG